MPVEPGRRLGSYDVISSLGAGGMGEVFLARDTKLGRDVALKTILAPLADEADRLSRFRREAHVLAAMNHPHIATIYEFNEVEDQAFLVMELVPGETLSDRLSKNRLTLSEALRICSQVAEALEAAHEKGIIHRDLKPANIKITPEGTVKVLDFGLAKELRGTASSDDPSQSLTTAISEGLVLGTIPYMSPEQARGKPVDRRTDIWSFGCVMFESIIGRRPFDGETTSDLVAAILEREPDWRPLPATTPAAIDRLLRRCLQKDPRLRLRDIGDARIELNDALAAPAGTRESVADGHRFKGSVARAIVWLAVVVTAGALVAWALRPNTPVAGQPSGHFVMSLPSGERLASLDFPAVAISPDDSLVAYVGTRGGRPQLFVRPLNSLDARPIPGTVDAFAPFFSPDNRWIGFFAEGKLKKVAVAGGMPVTVCDAPNGFGGSWGAGDSIVFAPATGSGLSQVLAAGGAPTRVTSLDAQKGEFSHRWPEWLPGGKAVLFTIGTLGSWDDAQIVAQSIESGQQTVLVRGGTNPHYLPPGHLLYARDGVLMAVPFDADRLRVRGTPAPVIDNVLQSFDGAVQATVSSSGSVVYVAGSLTPDDRRLIGVERSGSAAPLAAPPRAYSVPRVSPDGGRIAVTITGATEDLWTYDIAQGTLMQVTFEANHTSPIWTADGLRLTFTWAASGPGNLFWKMVPAGPDERLASSDNLQLPGSWSSDGRLLVFVQRHPTTGRDLWVLGEDRTARPFLASPSDESAPRFSPDGRVVAYVSNESGRNEVYVCAYADPSRKWRVSHDGGAEPVWDRGGQELFYRAGDRLMAATVQPGPAPHSGEPRALFEGRFEKGTLDSANYDVTPAHRFVLVEAAEHVSQQDELHMLLNWRPSLTSAGSR